jgi:hypothetical protein
MTGSQQRAGRQNPVLNAPSSLIGCPFSAAWGIGVMERQGFDFGSKASFKMLFLLVLDRLS